MAPLELTDLTPTQYAFFMKYLYNGVGSSQLTVNPHDLIFKKPAEFHDFESMGGGTNKDRHDSDDKFLKNCKAEVKKQSWWKQPFYFVVAHVYYTGLRIGSSFAWEYYETRPKDWSEFIIRVQVYYDKKKKSYPWAEEVLNPFTV